MFIFSNKPVYNHWVCDFVTQKAKAASAVTQRKRRQHLSEQKKRAKREKHTEYMRAYRQRPGSRRLASLAEKKSRLQSKIRAQAELDAQSSSRAISGLDRL